MYFRHSNFFYYFFISFLSLGIVILSWITLCGAVLCTGDI